MLHRLELSGQTVGSLLTAIRHPAAVASTPEPGSIEYLIAAPSESANMLGAPEGARKAEAPAFLGAFLGDHRPVQLTLRTAEGTVERSGLVVRSEPESGFHSPRVADPGEAERFAEAAFQPGPLVSNGFRLFWNRGKQGAQPHVARGVYRLLEAVPARKRSAEPILGRGLSAAPGLDPPATGATIWAATVTKSHRTKPARRPSETPIRSGSSIRDGSV